MCACSWHFRNTGTQICYTNPGTQNMNIITTLFVKYFRQTGFTRSGCERGLESGEWKEESREWKLQTGECRQWRFENGD